MHSSNTPFFFITVDDDLVKVLRVSETRHTEETPDDAAAARPRRLRGYASLLSNDFSVQVLSGVRFANLLETPAIPTILPSRIWEPARHARYPDSFKRACKQIMLCSRSDVVQPAPPVVTELVNAAAILPRAVWLKVLSYTTRDWFEPPRDAEQLLRRRLRDEEAALRQAEQARQRAETRLAVMERERDFYKSLALRWQARLRNAVGEDAADDADDGLLGTDQVLVRMQDGGGRNFLRLFGARLRRANRRLLRGDSDAEDEDHISDDEEQEDVDLEDHESVQDVDDDDHDDDDDDSQEEVHMEDVVETAAMEEEVAFSAPMGRAQVRTVSISGEEY